MEGMTMNLVFLAVLFCIFQGFFTKMHYFCAYNKRFVLKKKKKERKKESHCEEGVSGPHSLFKQ
jgi:hypothetical protein